MRFKPGRIGRRYASGLLRAGLQQRQLASSKQFAKPPVEGHEMAAEGVHRCGNPCVGERGDEAFLPSAALSFGLDSGLVFEAISAPFPGPVKGAEGRDRMRCNREEGSHRPVFFALAKPARKPPSQA